MPDKFNDIQIGSIVLFHIDGAPYYTLFNKKIGLKYVLQVIEIDNDYFIGNTIASSVESFSTSLEFTIVQSGNIDIETKALEEKSIPRILKETIKDYQILSKKDLPLLIGYNYKTPLFEKMLKG